MGGLTSKRRRSKKRKGSGLKGRARFERERERERERRTGIKDRREEEERERGERTRLGAMCIGERIHIVARFGGKVFGQVQGDAAPLLSLSLSLASFFFFSRSFTH